MMTTETYGEILEIAEAFEDSVTRALHQSKNTSEEDKGEEMSDGHTEELEASECEAEETLAYQDRRQRRGRGSRYNQIIGCLQKHAAYHSGE